MSEPAAASLSAEAPQRLTLTHWLIIFVAVLGFAFDTYELLVMPLIARPALSELRHVDPNTNSGQNEILWWNGAIMWASAISGGVFGLLGGYLTDRFGRRRVLTWSILLYAVSALATGFSTSAPMLLILRCTTFIGVCVEFVAAVAWLAELFPFPPQRERILGYTQAFSSLGGLMVSGLYSIVVQQAGSLPAILGEHSAWRYIVISGVIPAIPLIIIRPFLPESPAWQTKRAQGTLKRPSFGELFQPGFARTTVVTAALFACAFGAAFGAIQFTPQIVPGLVLSRDEQKELREVQGKYEEGKKTGTDVKAFQGRIAELGKKQQGTVATVQMIQELGGLVGRFFLAWLALRIVSRRKLLRVFLVPGLILVPLVFLIPGAGNLGDHSVDGLKVGIFLAGFFTVAQFSFWGNYLPRVYPTHLRGTGEGFAANVGGRMIGTAANPLTAFLAAELLGSVSGLSRPASIAYAAAAVAFLVYALANVFTFFLPEPRTEALPD